MTDTSRLDLIAGLSCRVWDPPSGRVGRTAILLHGRGGDENSMAVFRAAIPLDARVVSPRAPLADALGGFAWIPPAPESAWPVHDDFAAASLRLGTLVDELQSSSSPTHSQVMVGFSQGAAAAAAFAFDHHQNISALALLAGFVAEPSAGLLDPTPLLGMPVFLAFGTQDDLVPVPIVEQSIAILRRADASLTTCDSPVGHKVSAACLRSLREWLARVWQARELASAAGGDRGAG